jgi:hypothetical protein
MALVNKLSKITLEKSVPHQEVDATFSIIEEENEVFLQIDTYGSRQRKMKDKKSQSIRFTKDALKQLSDIISKL